MTILGFADPKPLGSFMVRSVKRTQENPRELVVNRKLSP